MFPWDWFLLQLSPTDDPESVYVYDLMATVVHILDSRTGGSLVGHIKVGETYHQRKEVRSPAGWVLSCPQPSYPQAAKSSPAPLKSCLAEGFSPMASSGVRLLHRPVPGSLSQVLSVWLTVPCSPKQLSAAYTPYGEGRAEEALFPHLLRLVPPGHRHVASLSLCFQVRAGTSSPFSRKGGWAGQSCSMVEMPKPGVPRVCQGCIPVSYLLHLHGVVVTSRAGTVPVQPECFMYALSPPRPAGISPQCPRKGGSSHMAWSHPSFPGNWVEESLRLPGGGPLRQCLCLSPQGVTHQQWYLFNDFLIEPVDKVSAQGHATGPVLMQDRGCRDPVEVGVLLHAGAPSPTPGCPCTVPPSPAVRGSAV